MSHSLLCICLEMFTIESKRTISFFPTFFFILEINFNFFKLRSRRQDSQFGFLKNSLKVFFATKVLDLNLGFICFFSSPEKNWSACFESQSSKVTSKLKKFFSSVTKTSVTRATSRVKICSKIFKVKDRMVAESV